MAWEPIGVGWTDRRMDGRTDGRTDGRMDGRTDDHRKHGYRILETQRVGNMDIGRPKHRKCRGWFRNGCNGPDINGPKVNTGQVEVDTEMDRILLARKSCNRVYGKSSDDRGVCKWFGFSELRRIGAMARKPIGGGSEHREVRWTCRMTLDRLDKGRMDESGHVPMMCNAMKAARVWMTARDGGNCSVMGQSKYIPDGTQAEEGEVNTQAESLSPLLGEVSKHQWRKNGHRVLAGASDFRRKLDMSHKSEQKGTEDMMQSGTVVQKKLRRYHQCFSGSETDSREDTIDGEGL
ncbi:hypothetical protein C8R48DRAFT_669866 [Suillus tomentosus]|nr:hypothetical protein C8R48DRAFT_669866 [Suillus tomentosus]